MKMSGEVCSDDDKIGQVGSNDGQITKSKPSDGRRAKFLSLATGFDYDWLRFKRYLGNVGSIRRSCLYLLRRLFRIAPMITPKMGYLGQPLEF